MLKTADWQGSLRKFQKRQFKKAVFFLAFINVFISRKVHCSGQSGGSTEEYGSHQPNSLYQILRGEIPGLCPSRGSIIECWKFWSHLKQHQWGLVLNVSWFLLFHCHLWIQVTMNIPHKHTWERGAPVWAILLSIHPNLAALQSWSQNRSTKSCSFSSVHLGLCKSPGFPVRFSVKMPMFRIQWNELQEYF